MALIAGAVARVIHQEELFPTKVNVNPAVLVVGGGIAGIEAALRIADSGKKVYLVEKEPSIGGHMAMLDKTFPTLDCSACILTPKMVQVRQHPNITLLTYTDVTGMEGYIGNFKVKLKRKARMVDETKCNSCGTCMAECPATAVPDAREIKVEGRLIQSFPAGVKGNGNNNRGK